MIETPDAPAVPPRSVDLVAAARALDDFLRALGHDQTRNPELIGTGARVAQAFASEFCAGESVDLEKIVAPHRIDAPSAAGAHGETGSPSARVLLRHLPLITMCPHHLLPAEGTADIAYEPLDHIVGIGALASLVEVAGRRLVLQETLSRDVTDVIARVLAPRWVLVRMRLAHSCMRLRGERAHGSEVETWSSSGTVPDSAYALLSSGGSR